MCVSSGVQCVRSVVVCDVTPRYAADWCTRVYKHRLDRTWWAESLRPFEPSDPGEQRREEEDIIGECCKYICNNAMRIKFLVVLSL